MRGESSQATYKTDLPNGEDTRPMRQWGRCVWCEGDRACLLNCIKSCKSSMLLALSAGNTRLLDGQGMVAKMVG